MRRALLIILGIAVLALPTSAGATIAYTQNGTLYIGDDYAQNARPIAQGVRAPHFTATPNQLAFFNASGEVSVIDVVTGATRVVDAAPPCANGCTTGWSPNGHTLAIRSASGDLSIAPVAGGAPTKIASTVEDFDFSPDSSQIAITRYNKDNWLRMSIIPAAGGPERLLPIGYAAFPLWTPIGLAVYSFNDHNRKLEQSIKLLDPETGKVRRKLYAKRIKRYRDTGPFRGQPRPIGMSTQRLLVLEAYRTRYVLRFMNHHGKTLTLLKLSSKDNFRAQLRKARLIVRRGDGRLQTVSLKTGRARTLVPSVDAFAVE